jgi:alpha-galactosidase
VVYWGAQLPEDEDLTLLRRAHALDVTGGMLDANPDLSICPEATPQFPRPAGADPARWRWHAAAAALLFRVRR